MTLSASLRWSTLIFAAFALFHVAVMLAWLLR